MNPWLYPRILGRSRRWKRCRRRHVKSRCLPFPPRPPFVGILLKRSLFNGRVFHQRASTPRVCFINEYSNDLEVKYRSW